MIRFLRDVITTRAASLLLATSLTVGFAVRAWLATHDDGLYWPDEIYQSLEPAHRLVYGQGLVAWEFVQGARSWVFPGLLAGVLKLLSLAGLSEPREYLVVIRLLFCAVGVATAAGCYRLARSFDASRLPAAVGASVFALAAPAIYFAPRAMSETASALLIVIGLALALDRRSGRAAFAGGSALLGVAVSIRLQSAIFCIGLLAILASRRDWRRLGDATLVLAGCLLLMGLLDLVTWGSFLHSAVAYLRFNVAQAGAETFGVEPASYYLQYSLTAMGPLAALLALLSLVAWRRAPELVLLCAAYLIAHSLVGHKEMRFLLPMLPLVCALSAVGLDVVTRQRRPVLWRSSLMSTLGLATISAATFRSLTFSDLGAFVQGRTAVSAYDDPGSVNRLLLAAHSRRDLCGLKVESVRIAWTGGFTYLHRPVRLYGLPGPDDGSRLYNYVITVGPPGPGRESVARDGGQVLARLDSGSCRLEP